MEQTKAGYDAMVAEAVGRAADGLPFIIYTWTPSAYVTQLIPGDNAMWLAMEADSVLDGSITPNSISAMTALPFLLRSEPTPARPTRATSAGSLLIFRSRRTTSSSPPTRLRRHFSSR